ncbi:myo-inositol-1-phosphate synthase [Rossellomorea vietnamensis]|uniref:Myo-inositol-1-phosphate synthase n=1 Tax=Rossellomorea vietnamensis TaxID=218284 RepID=A0A6I6UML5_9BACI|nr:inositol-3-phosphate synthase [Rossellomorea vietnamensis]QHE59800.1 myo-inositol-1-phosphate synthase [Rossellomorea vietnamensis]
MKKKVGVMIIGLNGSVSTCITGGVQAIKKQLTKPIGLITETEGFTDMCSLESLVFSGWDLRTQSHLYWMKRNGVVPSHMIDELKDEINQVNVLPAPKVQVTNPTLSLEGVDTEFPDLTYRETIKIIISDIKSFKEKEKLETVIVLNLVSVDEDPVLGKVHETLERFEQALDSNDPSITSGMLYAYSAIKCGSPYINFTPNTTVDIPALIEFSAENKVPVCGKDGKTGQTLYKTVLAPMFKHRNLKVTGWYSANILGNDDGKILNVPEQAATKIKTKTNVLTSILGESSELDHQVHIHYYKPRGDAKEAWDNIDFEGWLDTPMSMKVNWVGQDSALAAPLIVDLIRIIEFCNRKEEFGIIKELAPFFKAPYDVENHDFFEQINSLYLYVENLNNKVLEKI